MDKFRKFLVKRSIECLAVEGFAWTFCIIS